MTRTQSKYIKDKMFRPCYKRGCKGTMRWSEKASKYICGVNSMHRKGKA